MQVLLKLVDPSLSYCNLSIFSRASRTLRDETQVITFLSVRDKKNVGKTEKVTLFNAFLQAGLTDLDEIWHDGRSYGVASPKKLW